MRSTVVDASECIRRITSKRIVTSQVHRSGDAMLARIYSRVAGNADVSGTGANHVSSPPGRGGGGKHSNRKISKVQTTCSMRRDYRGLGKSLVYRFLGGIVRRDYFVLLSINSANSLVVFSRHSSSGAFLLFKLVKLMGAGG